MGRLVLARRDVVGERVERRRAARVKARPRGLGKGRGGGEEGEEGCQRSGDGPYGETEGLSSHGE